MAPTHQLALCLTCLWVHLVLGADTNDAQKQVISTANNAAGTTLPAVAESFVPGSGIPRLIHQVFLSGEDALQAEEGASASKFRRDWRRSCQVHNPGWKYILWTQAMAEELLRTHYPRFLPIFQSIKTIVLRGDAIRPLILHAYGGVYMDLDTECYAPIESSLSGNGLVLQGETPRQVNNAQMASAPAHPIWLMLQRRVEYRASQSNWTESNMEPREVLLFAGPAALTIVLRKALNLTSAQPIASRTYFDPQSEPGEQIERTRVRIQGNKEWFQACDWNRPLCRLHLARCAPVLRASLSARWRAARYREYMASINLTQPTYNEPEPPTDLPPPLTQAYKTLLWDSNSLMVTPRPPSSTWAAPLRRSHSRYLTLQQPDPAANQPSFHLDAIDCAATFGRLVGAHQFSGSWLKPKKHHKASGSVTLIDKDYMLPSPPIHDKAAETQLILANAAEGLVAFFNLSSLFKETSLPLNLATQSPGPDTPTPDTDDSTTAQSLASQQDSDSITAALDAAWSWVGPHVPLSDAAGTEEQACHVLTVTQLGGSKNASGMPCCEAGVSNDARIQDLVKLATWAASHQCTMTAMLDGQPDDSLASTLSGLGVTVVQKTPCMGPKCDAGDPSLAQILTEWQEEHTDQRLTALHIALQDTGTWAALQQLHKSGSDILRTLSPRVLLLDTGALTLPDMPMLVPAYQHIYQELGYIGYHQARLGTHAEVPKQGGGTGTGNRKLLEGGGDRKAADVPRAACRVCAPGPDMILSPLRLGFVSTYADPPSWQR